MLKKSQEENNSENNDASKSDQDGKTGSEWLDQIWDEKFDPFEYLGNSHNYVSEMDFQNVCITEDTQRNEEGKIDLAPTLFLQ